VLALLNVSADNFGNVLAFAAFWHSPREAVTIVARRFYHFVEEKGGRWAGASLRAVAASQRWEL
jgi:hypothetical protein